MTRAQFAEDAWLGRVLSEYRWFRRWVGGRWERWYLDVVHSDLWFRAREHGGERPCAIARGTPTCEDWS